MSSLSKFSVSNDCNGLLKIYFMFWYSFYSNFFYKQLLENNVEINTAFKNNDVYLHLETSKY